MPSPSGFLTERDQSIKDLIAAKITTQTVKKMPKTDGLPLEGNHWLRVEHLTCVYADLVGSTKLQVTNQPQTAAKVYQLFVENLVRTFRYFDSDYIDVRGDGAFAIFSGKNSAIVGLCAAVTFKTLCGKKLKTAIRGFEILSHIGIDQKGVLLKRVGQRGEWQNEVWAGKPVNMAAKLSALADSDQILVSDRVFQALNSEELRKWAILSCGCKEGVPSMEYTSLWTEKDVSQYTYFDFEKAYFLKSNWCDSHGDEYCAKLLAEAAKD